MFEVLIANYATGASRVLVNCYSDSGDFQNSWEVDRYGSFNTCEDWDTAWALRDNWLTGNPSLDGLRRGEQNDWALMRDAPGTTVSVYDSEVGA